MRYHHCVQGWNVSLSSDGEAIISHRHSLITSKSITRLGIFGIDTNMCTLVYYTWKLWKFHFSGNKHTYTQQFYNYNGSPHTDVIGVFIFVLFCWFFLYQLAAKIPLEPMISIPSSWLKAQLPRRWYSSQKIRSIKKDFHGFVRLRYLTDLSDFDYL